MVFSDIVQYFKEDSVLRQDHLVFKPYASCQNRRMKKIALLFVAALVLTSCSQADGGSPSSAPTQSMESNKATASIPEPTKKALDLNGKWKQTNSHSEGDYMVAEIKKDVISVDWELASEDMKAVYWIGSYAAPKGSENTYSWTSSRDKEKTDSALLAATSESKDFAYAEGVISFDVTMQGTTRTIKMERVK